MISGFAAADANQAQAAVHRDLLPPNVPLSFKSSPLPVPLFQVPLIQQPTALGNPSSSTDEALIPEFHVGGVSRRIQGDGYVAPGWKSITPRSVLGNDRVATTSMEGQGSDAMVYAQVVIPDSEEGDAKRHKIDHDLQSWVDALMLDS